MDSSDLIGDLRRGFGTLVSLLQSNGHNVEEASVLHDDVLLKQLNFDDLQARHQIVINNLRTLFDHIADSRTQNLTIDRKDVFFKYCENKLSKLFTELHDITENFNNQKGTIDALHTIQNFDIVNVDTIVKQLTASTDLPDDGLKKMSEFSKHYCQLIKYDLPERDANICDLNVKLENLTSKVEVLSEENLHLRGELQSRIEELDKIKEVNLELEQVNCRLASENAIIETLHSSRLKLESALNQSNMDVNAMHVDELKNETTTSDVNLMEDYKKLQMVNKDKEDELKLCLDENTKLKLEHEASINCLKLSIDDLGAKLKEMIEQNSILQLGKESDMRLLTDKIMELESEITRFNSEKSNAMQEVGGLYMKYANLECELEQNQMKLSLEIQNCSSLEAKVAELTEKMKIMENELSDTANLLKEEKCIVQEKNDDYTKLQVANKEKEDELKSRLEEYVEKMKILENQLSETDNLLKHEKCILQEKNNDYSKLQLANKEKEDELKSHLEEYVKMQLANEANVKCLEDELKVLIEQNSILELENEPKLNALTSKITELEAEILNLHSEKNNAMQVANEEELEGLRTICTDLQSALDQSRTELALEMQNRSALEKQVLELTIKIEDLEKNLSHTSSLLQQEKIAIQEKLEDYAKLKIANKEKEDSMQLYYEANINDLEAKLKDLKEQHAMLQTRNESELSTLINKITELENELCEINKLLKLEIENGTNAKQMIAKLTEEYTGVQLVNNVKDDLHETKLKELTHQQLRITQDLKSEINALRKENNKLNKLNEVLKIEMIECRNKSELEIKNGKALKSEIETLKSDMETSAENAKKLQNLFNEESKSNENAKRNVTMLSEEINGLKLHLKFERKNLEDILKCNATEVDFTVKKLKSELKRYETTISNLKAISNDQQNELDAASLTFENSTALELAKDLNDKNKDIKILRALLESEKEKYQTLERENNKLREEIVKLKLPCSKCDNLEKTIVKLNEQLKEISRDKSSSSMNSDSPGTSGFRRSSRKSEVAKSPETSSHNKNKNEVRERRLSVQNENRGLLPCSKCTDLNKDIRDLRSNLKKLHNKNLQLIRNLLDHFGDFNTWINYALWVFLRSSTLKVLDDFIHVMQFIIAIDQPETDCTFCSGMFKFLDGFKKFIPKHEPDVVRMDVKANLVYMNKITDVLAQHIRDSLDGGDEFELELRRVENLFGVIKVSRKQVADLDYDFRSWIELPNWYMSRNHEEVSGLMDQQTSEDCPNCARSKALLMYLQKVRHRFYQSVGYFEKYDTSAMWQELMALNIANFLESDPELAKSKDDLFFKF